MKLLLLLCLGLTLVCASNHDVVKCNFDMSQVEFGECRSLHFGGDLGDSEGRWSSWRVRVFDVRPMGWFLTLDQEQLYHVER